MITLFPKYITYTNVYLKKILNNKNQITEKTKTPKTKKTKTLKQKKKTTNQRKRAVFCLCRWHSFVCCLCCTLFSYLYYRDIVNSCIWYIITFSCWIMLTPSMQYRSTFICINIFPISLKGFNSFHCLYVINPLSYSFWFIFKSQNKGAWCDLPW